MHKYLYAECDPVDNDDPKGHDIGDGISFGVSAGSAVAVRFLGSLTANEIPTSVGSLLANMQLADGKTHSVNDAMLKMELASVYKRLSRFDVGGYELQNGDTDTTFYLNSDYPNSAYYWYWKYTGSAFPELTGLTMTGHELNYIGTGYAMGVYGYPRYQAIALTKFCMHNKTGMNKTNALAASLAGYNYYKKKDKK